jgi:hypothetical protein
MGEGRDNRFSFRMADDEGRVLVAQSLGCDQHPYAVKQFGCQSNRKRSTQAIWAPSPEAAGKSPRAGVIPTFAANERGKRFGFRFVLHRVPPHARPLGSRSPADLPRVGGAGDHVDFAELACR